MARDRLSDLPDDLLRRILYFAPSKEAASTSALARRWRSLWLSAGAVNLDTLIYDRKFDFGPSFVLPKHEVFFRDAEAALAAADGRRGCCPVRRLTLHVEQHRDLGMFLFYGEDHSEHQLVDVVLSSPAARHVEELRIGTGSARSYHGYVAHAGVYELGIDALPSETLRVLHISNCRNLWPAALPGAAAFPLMEELRLHICGFVWLQDLQGIIDTAPRLATLELDSVRFNSRYDESSETDDGSPPSVPRASLRCPAVTALLLANCELKNCDWQDSIELDAPMLRCFRYEGDIERFSLKSQAPDVARVELSSEWFHRSYQNDDKARQLFWQFLESIINARVLKLRMKYLEDMAVAGEKTKVELLGGNRLFRNLERLELEALYKPTGMAAGVAIANFLHCCPVIRVLRLNLSTAGRDSYIQDSDGFLQRKDQQDFGKSVDHFLRRRSKPMNPLGDDNYEISDIPGLSEHSFSCLQSSLRYVSLQFRTEKLNGFGVRLAKFFAENAMLLEEIYIDNGNKKFREHINHKVARWIANSSKRRKSPNSTGVAILPLERTP